MMRPMRVLLLEDDQLLGEGLGDFLRADGHVVDWCHTVSQAQTLAATEPFDAWLVDWQLPDGSGLQWLRLQRQRGATTPALMLTARDMVRDRIEGLDGGADDYLVKPFAPEELAARLNACVRRHQPRRLSLSGGIELEWAIRSVRLADEAVSLTAREWALLEALARRAGRWVAKADLDQLVLGFDGALANSNSLEVHISNLRRKLGRDCIETQRGMGYRVVAA
jgi:two-component system, OmpR family, response regulator